MGIVAERVGAAIDVVNRRRDLRRLRRNRGDRGDAFCGINRMPDGVVEPFACASDASPDRLHAGKRGVRVIGELHVGTFSETDIA